MFRKNKFYSLLCLSVYLLVSTNCAPWLIYTGGELLFGIVYNEYACKGGNCGCTSAFKCLTDCCCEKVSRDGEIIASCRTESLESCCSSSEPECLEDESCCSEEELAKDEKPKSGIPCFEDSKCSPGLAESMTEGRTFHLIIQNEEGEDFYSFASSGWLSTIDNYDCNFAESISKIPIS